MESNQSVYFCKGFADFEFTAEQMTQISKMVGHDPNGRSFMVYDESPLHKALDLWKQNFDWIDVHYPIKTMPEEFILKGMLERNQNFDAASKGEMQLLLKLGVDPLKIIYSNPIKDQQDMIFAESIKVPYTVADTIQELEKIHKFSPKMKTLWRISVDDPAKGKQHGSFGEKFGAPVGTEEEVRRKMLQILEKGYLLHGVAFHTGSNHHGSAENLERALSLARMVTRVAKECGHPMGMIDLGGGLPAGILPEPIVNLLKSTKQDHDAGIKIIAEPGRHFATNCYNLVVRVVGIREKEDKIGYYLNDGIYHSFNNLLTDGVSLDEIGDAYYYHIKGDVQERDFKKERGILYGMTCCGQDILARNMPLPAELNIGDWLCFQGMGAYTLAIRSTFNSMDSVVRIEKLMTEQEQEELLRTQLKQKVENDPVEATEHVPDLPKKISSKNNANFRYWIMKQVTV